MTQFNAASFAVEPSFMLPPLHGVQGRGDDIQRFYELAKGKGWKLCPGSKTTWVLFLEEINVVLTGQLMSDSNMDILIYETSRSDFIKNWEAKEYIDYTPVEAASHAKVKYDCMRVIAQLKNMGLWK